jgi:hypothetical protein
MTASFDSGMGAKGHPPEDGSTFGISREWTGFETVDTDPSSIMAYPGDSAVVYV